MTVMWVRLRSNSPDKETRRQGDKEARRQGDRETRSRRVLFGVRIVLRDPGKRLGFIGGERCGISD